MKNREGDFERDRPLFFLLKGALAALLLMICALPTFAAAPLMLDDFEGGLDTKTTWEVKSFLGETRYEIVEEALSSTILSSPFTLILVDEWCG